MKNSIIAIIITTLIIAPIAYIADMYLVADGQHRNLGVWMLVVATASIAGILSSWAINIIKKKYE